MTREKRLKELNLILDDALDELDQHGMLNKQNVGQHGGSCQGCFIAQATMLKALSQVVQLLGQPVTKEERENE